MVQQSVYIIDRCSRSLRLVFRCSIRPGWGEVGGFVEINLSPQMPVLTSTHGKCSVNSTGPLWVCGSPKLSLPPVKRGGPSLTTRPAASCPPPTLNPGHSCISCPTFTSWAAAQKQVSENLLPQVHTSQPALFKCITIFKTNPTNWSMHKANSAVVLRSKSRLHAALVEIQRDNLFWCLVKTSCPVWLETRVHKMWNRSSGFDLMPLTLKIRHQKTEAAFREEAFTSHKM